MLQAAKIFLYLREYFLLIEISSDADYRVERRVVAFQVGGKVFAREAANIFLGPENRTAERVVFSENEFIKDVVHRAHRHVLVHVNLLDDGAALLRYFFLWQFRIKKDVADDIERSIE